MIHYPLITLKDPLTNDQKNVSKKDGSASRQMMKTFLWGSSLKIVLLELKQFSG